MLYSCMIIIPDRKLAWVTFAYAPGLKSFKIVLLAQIDSIVSIGQNLRLFELLLSSILLLQYIHFNLLYCVLN